MGKEKSKKKIHRIGHLKKKKKRIHIYIYIYQYFLTPSALNIG